MIREDFRIEPADWITDLDALRTVREQVFVIEQEVPIEDEWDAFDARSRHVLARDAENRPIGTGRLTPERLIGRMGVLREWRGRGVGEALLKALLDQARALGYPAVEMHAQVHAIPFYAKYGFQAYGEEFVECAITHKMMRLGLAPLERRPAAVLPPRPEPRVFVAEDVIRRSRRSPSSLPRQRTNSPSIRAIWITRFSTFRNPRCDQAHCAVGPARAHTHPDSGTAQAAGRRPSPDHARAAAAEPDRIAHACGRAGPPVCVRIPYQRPAWLLLPHPGESQRRRRLNVCAGSPRPAARVF